MSAIDDLAAASTAVINTGERLMAKVRELGWSRERALAYWNQLPLSVEAKQNAMAQFEMLWPEEKQEKQ